MGSCLCAPTGMLTTLKRNCNCGTSTVMSSWTKGICRAHNGHDNLVQELHLWNGHVDWQHHVSTVEPSIALNTTSSKKSSPRATVEPRIALNTTIATKSSPRATVEPSNCAQYDKLQEVISQSHCRTTHCAEYDHCHEVISQSHCRTKHCA